MTTHADRDRSERRAGAPAGQPLHEPADRDADNVPSDVEREYAEAILDATFEEHGSHTPGEQTMRAIRAARACVEVEDRLGFLFSTGAMVGCALYTQSTKFRSCRLLW